MFPLRWDCCEVFAPQFWYPVAACCNHRYKEFIILVFPFHFFSFCIKLTKSMRMVACVVWLSPLEAVQRREWVTASTSIVKLEVETVQAALAVFCTLFNSEASPGLVFGDWAISVHYEILLCAVFLSEKLDLWLRFACWPSSTVPSQIFWHECLIEMPESVWVPFPFLGGSSCGSGGSIVGCWSCSGGSGGSSSSKYKRGGNFPIDEKVTSMCLG